MLLNDLTLNRTCSNCLKAICVQVRDESCASDAQTTRVAIIAALIAIVMVTSIISLTCCILIQRSRDDDKYRSYVITHKTDDLVMKSPDTLTASRQQYAPNTLLSVQKTIVPRPYDVATLATEIFKSKSQDTTVTGDVAFTAPKDSIIMEGPRTPSARIKRVIQGNVYRQTRTPRTPMNTGEHLVLPRLSRTKVGNESDRLKTRKREKVARSPRGET